jgi:hypothetical protein
VSDAVGHVHYLKFSERLSNMKSYVSLHVLFYNLFKNYGLNVKVLLACFVMLLC